MRRHAGGAKVWRLRPGIRNPRSGTPRVAVRPYYEGLPSMAGRGTERRRRKPPRTRGGSAPRSAPRKHGSEVKSRHSGAPGGERADRKARGAFAKVPDVTQRLSALRSLTSVREGKCWVREGRGRRTQKRVYARLRHAMADQIMGTMNHVNTLLECVA